VNDAAGTKLAELIEQARDVDGIDAVAVIDRDGMLLAASASEETDTETLGAAAASGLLVADALGAELGRGEATQTTVELRDGTVILTPLDEDLALVIVARPTANLGRLRLLARRSRGDLLAAAREFVVLPGSSMGMGASAGATVGDAADATATATAYAGDERIG